MEQQLLNCMRPAPKHSMPIKGGYWHVTCNWTAFSGMQEKKTAVMTLMARSPSPSTAAAGPQDSGVVLVTGNEPTANKVAIPVALGEPHNPTGGGGA